MPERYSDNERRPVQGGYSHSGAQRPVQRPAQGSAQRPVQRPTQGSAQRPVQRPAQGSAQRPAQRPAQGSAQRPVQGSAQRPVQRPAQGSAQRPVQRPAQGGAQRPVQRPAQGSVQRPVQRPAQGGAQRPVQRPTQGSAQRPVQRTAQRPAQRPVQRTNASRNTARRGSYGRTGASGGLIHMTPVAKWICAALCVVLLVVICLAVTNKVRSNIPQPGISMNTGALSPEATIQPTAEVNVEPVTTQSATDVPGGLPTLPPAPTDEPAAAATNVPAVPENQTNQSAGNRSVRIRAMGDVIIDEDMLEKAYDKGSDSYDFSPLFELAQGVMSDADWSIINIEATLREGRYGYSGYPQVSTPPSILDALKECGIDMLTMCNNHALDGYFDGLKLSLDLAEEAGFAHVGAFRTQAERDIPEVYDIGGIKVGMVNYTQYTNGMASLSDEEATIYGMRLMDGAKYEQDIADLKAAGAEFTIAIMHWGEEYIRYPEDDIKAVAKRLVAAGADLVIGGHPHVVQPSEYVTATDASGSSRTALVVYSLGNFISNHRHERAAYTDNGVIFDFTLRENAMGQIELADPNLIPVYVWKYDDGSEYAAYRVVASGDGTPSGMDSEQKSRMRESYQEIVDLTGSTIEIRAH